MNNLYDLRKILSQNIKKCRGTLNITQAKLAEFANISTSYVVDIESCRTWVSDKTLMNIARVFNMEVYELFVPGIVPKTSNQEKKQIKQQHITGLINKKKKMLRHEMDETFSNLVLEIISLYEEK